MFTKKWKQWFNQAALAALVLLCCSFARAEGEKKASDKPVRLWIGIQLQNPDDSLLNEELKVQLNLEGGVIITEVLLDSPAKKVGFQKHDIITQYGEVKLKTPKQLIEAVAKGKVGQEVSVQLIRSGKAMTLKVTPVKWPFTVSVKPAVVTEFHANLHALRIYTPSAVLAGTYLQQLEFPKNTSLTISREGDKPAVIVVKRGDKTWQVTKEKLAELPKDIFPIVYQMLHQRAGMVVRYGAPIDFSGPPHVPSMSYVVPVQPGNPYQKGRILIQSTQPIAPQIKLQFQKSRAIEKQLKAHGQHQKIVKTLRLQASSSGSLEEIKQLLLQLSKDVAELKKQSSDSK